ncbi:MAG TPA: DNA polymerase III subunit gamma/tau [Candidatus Saccharimonadales bacterium]|nr:DNA polymerase III subunit gamma/tau [Candidatus Saccharimonadales bacterium]
MGQALYRKHRPKKLEQVVGQEHITKTLDRALKQGRISHAYLFTGPKGVGKTSVARILAHEINGLPYEEDQPHLDIIEIDAASNRRIDEIRELRDKVYVAPALAKYKVYIIDEVHMLTREAFNALLKTLEEPPEHAVFILATTDAHKLPETIVSRTQRYSFKPVEAAAVVAQLKDIAKQEKITAEDAAFDLLAEHGEGSFRDSISLLDQASSHGEKVTADKVNELLGIPPRESLLRLRQTVANKDVAGIVQALTDLYGQGYQASAIAKELGQLIRNELVNNQAPAIHPSLLFKLLEVAPSSNPERYLEIALVEYAFEHQPNQTTAEATPSVEEPAAAPEPESETDLQSDPEPEPISEKPAAKPAARKVKHSLGTDIWPEVLNSLKGNRNTLYGIVRMAEPRFEADGIVTLAFAFPFHQKRLNETRNRQALSEVLENLTGSTVEVNAIVDKAAQPARPVATVEAVKTEPAKAKDPNLSTISNIFGGAELLE